VAGATASCRAFWARDGAVSARQPTRRISSRMCRAARRPGWRGRGGLYARRLLAEVSGGGRGLWFGIDLGLGLGKDEKRETRRWRGGFIVGETCWRG
jgi:hypothetical protein